MLSSSQGFNRLLEALQTLPGIGPKSAQRLALFLLNSPQSVALNLAAAIQQAREQVRLCNLCFNYSDSEQCAICSDPERDRTTLCVVATPVDLAAIERTRQYKGVYHVLQGVISPLEGIKPEDLRIAELLKRLEGGQVKEVILATNPTVEGDATALYLGPLIREKGVRASRLALGLPAGGDLDYADQLTVTMALQGRREI